MGHCNYLRLSPCSRESTFRKYFPKTLCSVGIPANDKLMIVFLAYFPCSSNISFIVNVSWTSSEVSPCVSRCPYGRCPFNLQIFLQPVFSLLPNLCWSLTATTQRHTTRTSPREGSRCARGPARTRQKLLNASKYWRNCAVSFVSSFIEVLCSWSIAFIHCLQFNSTAVIFPFMPTTSALNLITLTPTPPPVLMGFPWTPSVVQIPHIFLGSFLIAACEGTPPVHLLVSRFFHHPAQLVFVSEVRQPLLFVRTLNCRTCVLTVIHPFGHSRQPFFFRGWAVKFSSTRATPLESRMSNR